MAHQPGGTKGPERAGPGASGTPTSGTDVEQSRPGRDERPERPTEVLRLEIPHGLLIGLGVAAAVLGFLLVWRVAHVLLVVFAGILVAVLLDGMARWIMEHLRLPRPLALVMVLGGLCAACGIFALRGGPDLADQVAELTQRVPEAASRLEARMQQTRWGRLLIDQALSPSELLSSGARLVGRVPTLFTDLTGVATNLVFIFLIGVYAAFDPSLYTRGALHLVPKAGRRRTSEVLEAVGHALRWWLIGRLAAMLAVGTLTGAGLWLVGIPLAPALGAIAGFFSFVPFVGPIASAIPALLVALALGLAETFWVVAVYVGVQFVEGNFLTPLIQQRVVSLPPAMLLSAQLAMTILFGLVGMILATPLTVVAMVLVQMLYVRGMLGDPVPVLGERRP